MWKFGLLGVIILNNKSQFASTIVVDFCHDLEVQTKFIYIFHPQANRQVESANKVIFKGIKNKLDDAKWVWVEQLLEVL